MADYSIKDRNRIELRGTVTDTLLQQDRGVNVLSFVISTVIGEEPWTEIIYHQIVAHELNNIRNIPEIQKGRRVYVEGLLNYNRYITPSGENISNAIIHASRVAIIGEDGNIIGKG